MKPSPGEMRILQPSPTPECTNRGNPTMLAEEESAIVAYSWPTKTLADRREPQKPDKIPAERGMDTNALKKGTTFPTGIHPSGPTLLS